jgi:hypothetical protein
MNRYYVPIIAYPKNNDGHRLYATLEIESPDKVDAMRVASNWVTTVHRHRTDLFVETPVLIPIGRVLSTTYHE